MHKYSAKRVDACESNAVDESVYAGIGGDKYAWGTRTFIYRRSPSCEKVPACKRSPREKRIRDARFEVGRALRGTIVRFTCVRSI